MAKNAFISEGRHYGMALKQNQNYKQISNNLNRVSKTPEHKGTLSIPADRELLTSFTLLLYLVYCEFLRDYLFFFEH